MKPRTLRGERGAISLRRLGSVLALLLIVGSPAATANTPPIAALPPLETSGPGDNSPANRDFFGASLAADGDMLVVGAPGTSWTFAAQLVNGVGALHVFTTADPADASSPIVLQAVLKPPSSSTTDLALGVSCGAVAAERLVVGGGRGAGATPGKAFVYHAANAADLTAWSLRAELTPPFTPVASDQYGADVAISAVDADTMLAVVGAPGYSNSNGRAYAFTATRAGGSDWDTWSSGTRLQPAIAYSGSQYFGHSVDVSVEQGFVYVIVGAPLGTVAGGNSVHGFACIFNHPSATVTIGASWTERKRIENGGGAYGGGRMGSSVALSGTTAVVGARWVTSMRGEVLVYVADDPTSVASDWSIAPGTGTSGESSNGDELGGAVAIAGTTVLAGAKGFSGFEGAVVVINAFTPGDPTSTWSFAATGVAFARAAQARIGSSAYGTSKAVAVWGMRALAGSDQAGHSPDNVEVWDLADLSGHPCAVGLVWRGACEAECAIQPCLRLTITSDPAAGQCDRGMVPVASAIATSGANVTYHLTGELTSGARMPVSVVAGDVAGQYKLYLAKAAAPGAHTVRLTLHEMHAGTVGVRRTLTREVNVLVTCAAGASASGAFSALRVHATLKGAAIGDVDTGGITSAVVDGLGVVNDAVGTLTVSASSDGDGSSIAFEVLVPREVLPSNQTVAVVLDMAGHADTAMVRQLAYRHLVRTLSRASNVCCVGSLA